jgi:hypothetical protein
VQIPRGFTGQAEGYLGKVFEVRLAIMVAGRRDVRIGFVEVGFAGGRGKARCVAVSMAFRRFVRWWVGRRCSVYVGHVFAGLRKGRWVCEVAERFAEPNAWIEHIERIEVWSSVEGWVMHVS